MKVNVAFAMMAVNGTGALFFLTLFKCFALFSFPQEYLFVPARKEYGYLTK